jgi:HEAT repeat protein
MPLIRKPLETPREATPTGAEGLANPSPDIRWSTVRTIGSDPANVPALVEALGRETDMRVREAMFTALARIGTAQSASAMLPYVRSDDARLRTIALDALKAMPREAARHLETLLDDPDSDVRLLSCELARDAPGADAPRLLCALLETETHANVCAAAIEVLAEIGDASAVPTLVRCGSRFRNDPFLAFAISAASERLGAPDGGG